MMAGPCHVANPASQSNDINSDNTSAKSQACKKYLTYKRDIPVFVPKRISILMHCACEHYGRAQNFCGIQRDDTGGLEPTRKGRNLSLTFLKKFCMSIHKERIGKYEVRFRISCAFAGCPRICIAPSIGGDAPLAANGERCVCYWLQCPRLGGGRVFGDYVNLTAGKSAD